MREKGPLLCEWGDWNTPKGKDWLPEPTSWLEVETLSYTPYFQGADKG